MSARSNPWDRPKPLPDDAIPESTPEELYSAIGRAVTAWSEVEHRLCLLFVGIYLGSNGYAAYKLYGALPSTAARMTAIKVSAEASFAARPEHAAYAKAVVALTEKYLGRRNDIAHGLIALRDEGRASLIEPYFNLRHGDKTGGYEYEASDIRKYAEQFLFLCRELDHALFLLKTPGRRGGRVTPSEGTPLSEYVEPHRTALAKKKAGLGRKRSLRAPRQTGHR